MSSTSDNSTKKLTASKAKSSDVKPTQVSRVDSLFAQAKKKEPASAGGAALAHQKDCAASADPKGVAPQVATPLKDLLAKVSAIKSEKPAVRAAPPTTFAQAAAPGPQDPAALELVAQLRLEASVAHETEKKELQERKRAEMEAAQIAAVLLRRQLYEAAMVKWTPVMKEIDDALETVKRSIASYSVMFTEESLKLAKNFPETEASKEILAKHHELFTLQKQLLQAQADHQAGKPMSVDEEAAFKEKKAKAQAELDAKAARKAEADAKKATDAQKLAYETNVVAFYAAPTESDSKKLHHNFAQVCKTIATKGAISFTDCCMNNIDPKVLTKITTTIMVSTEQHKEPTEQHKEPTEQHKEPIFVLNESSQMVQIVPNVRELFTPYKSGSVKSAQEYIIWCVKSVCYKFYTKFVIPFSFSVGMQPNHFLQNAVYFEADYSPEERAEKVRARKEELSQFKPSKAHQKESVPAAPAESNEFAPLAPHSDVVLSDLQVVPPEPRKPALKTRGVVGGGCAAAVGGERRPSTSELKVQLREEVINVGKAAGGIPVGPANFPNAMAWTSCGQAKGTILRALKSLGHPVDTEGQILAALVEQGLIEKEDSTVKSKKGADKPVRKVCGLKESAVSAGPAVETVAAVANDAKDAKVAAVKVATKVAKEADKESFPPLPKPTAGKARAPAAAPAAAAPAAAAPAAAAPAQVFGGQLPD